MMRRTSAKVALGGVAAITLIGILFVAVLLRPAPEVEVSDNTSARAVARWCDDLDEAFVADGPFASFDDVARAAIAGKLEEPRDRPPRRDATALEAWQAEHAAYLTSSYLELLDTEPQPVVWTGLTFKVALIEAHDGKPVGTPVAVRAAARTLDRFRHARCR